MRDAIRNRISRRTFGKPLDAYEIDEINGLIRQVNEMSGLALCLDTEAAQAFSNKKYTKGFISHATSAILMKGPSSMENLREKIGYYGEGLVLDLVDRGYGTCWVAGTMDSSRFSVDDGETLVCVVVVGNVEKEKVSEKTIRCMIRANGGKKPADMIESDTQIPQWIMDGMEAVSKAPSAVNTQKPHFKFIDGVLTAEVPDTYIMDRVDLGIAKRHFVECEGGSFDFGNGGAYHIVAE